MTAQLFIIQSIHQFFNSFHIQNLFTIPCSDDDEPKEKPSAGVHATKMGPDDIQLHVHSDHGTGGHWCAKILFFSLMAVLLGLIGLILLENRGLQDCKFIINFMDAIYFVY